MPEPDVGAAAVPAGAAAGPTAWSPWRVVVGFGAISLAGDMVYEGARSVFGPLLISLGASAVVVGAVTGAGEAAALVLRVVFGPLADRTGRYWTLTITGYALTAVCVPLLALTPLLGGAGLAVAAGLILAERTGKAVRSPAKSALLADAAGQVGMGRGLGVHKALDQIGAFAGPLLVAALVAAGGGLSLALAVLAVPGALAMMLLVVTRRRLPAPANAAPPCSSPPTAGPGFRVSVRRTPLPATFREFAIAAALCTAGLVTFGLISFHLIDRDLVPTAGVPLLYAAAMASGALAALGTGRAYDRLGPRVLLALPFVVTAATPLVFAGSFGAVLVGVLLWGTAVGLQDSTVKAMVADLVPRERRATAYGVFAGAQGVGALLGGVGAGALYEQSIPLLVAAIAVVQVVALALLVRVEARRSRTISV